MSHDLANTSTGNAMMAYRGETPWHQLGQRVPDGATGKEMLIAAGLDWEVATGNVITTVKVKTGESATGWNKELDAPIMEPVYKEITTTIPGMKSVVRTDTGAALGVVGEGFQVFPNASMVELFDAIACGGEINYETAGGLGGGETVWMLANIPALAMSIKGDEIMSYMLIQNGHTGRTKLKATPTTVRVVCANTLKAANVAFAKARKGGKVNTVNVGYEIKHTKKMNDNVEVVKAAYAKHVEDFNLTKEMFEVLAGVPLTAEKRDEFFKWVVEGAEKDETKVSDRAKAKRKTILDTLGRLEASPTNQTAATSGTMFGLLNIGTEYVDHERGTRVTDDNMTDAESRFESANFGSGDRMKAEMLDKVLALAGV